MNRIFMTGCFLAATLSACASLAPTQSPKEAKLPDPGPSQTYHVNFPDLGEGEARYITIELGPDTFEHCRHVDAKFPFDSSRARAEDAAQLKAMASCLNHPEMKDRTVQLIGRADARGTSTYNLELGQERAEHIRQILIQNGLAADRIQVWSRGKQGAHASDQAYLDGFDRRVDVVVVGGAHTP